MSRPAAKVQWAQKRLVRIKNDAISASYSLREDMAARTRAEILEGLGIRD